MRYHHHPGHLNRLSLGHFAWKGHNTAHACRRKRLGEILEQTADDIRQQLFDPQLADQYVRTSDGAELYTQHATRNSPFAEKFGVLGLYEDHRHPPTNGEVQQAVSVFLGRKLSLHLHRAGQWGRTGRYSYRGT
jgi:hypothetical protein